jgi:hypothetical protein
MTRERHPNLRQFADLRDGTLSSAVDERTRRHLAGCARCGRRARRLERIVSALAHDDLPAPPERVLRAAMGLLRETGRLDLPAEWDIAELVMDVAPGALAGVRSLDAATRHLLWRVRDLELDAHLTRDAGRTRLVAHVLPVRDDATPLEKGDVELYRGPRRVGRSSIDVDGRFAFDGLRAGVYSLRGRVGTARFAIAELVIA